MLYIFLLQFVTDESSGYLRKLYSYITDFWNLLDLLTIVLFIGGIVLQVQDCDACFESARIVLAINLMTFFFRILHILSVHKELGPKLVMIGRMVCNNMCPLMVEDNEIIKQVYFDIKTYPTINRML